MTHHEDDRPAPRGDHGRAGDPAEADERLQRLASQLPREVAPSRDLWPSIRNRIEHPQRHEGRVRARRPRRAMLVLALPLAAAAALGLVWLGPFRQAKPEPAAGAPAVMLHALASLEEECVTTRTLLDATDTVEPAARARTELLVANVRIVESAIEETRRAVRENPTNGRLGVLIGTYRDRVALLRKSVRRTISLDQAAVLDEPRKEAI